MNQGLDIIFILTKPKYRHKYTYPLLTEQGRLKPRIPVRIYNFENGKHQTANALIDTGSDSCIIPSYISEFIGHKLTQDDRKVKGVKGIENKEVETYVHGFKIELLAPDNRTPIRLIDVVGYTVKADHAYPILGTNMFLEFFKISIDYKKRKIILEW